jgi:hypothetical protein
MPSFPLRANPFQRERSRSPRRRSRSPRRSRRSYSPRSRSRSRDDYRRSERRSRSPMTSAAGASGGHSGSGHRGAPPPQRSFEERAVAKEQMMQSIRDSSQQDRRVYVGNLAYDVKWHHLKDFMRQGQLSPSINMTLTSADRPSFHSWRSSLCRCLTTSQWNVEGGRQRVMWLVFSGFSLVILMDVWIDGLDLVLGLL